VVVLMASIRNVGKKPACLLNVGSSFFRQRSIEVTVNGKVSSFCGPKAVPPPPPPVDAFIELAAGAVDSAEVRLHASNWGLKDWQGAQLTFTYANPQPTAIASPFNRKAGGWRQVTGLWTGSARSGTITLGDAEAPKAKPASRPGKALRAIRFTPDPHRSAAYVTGVQAEVYLVADGKVIQLVAPLPRTYTRGPVEFRPGKDKSEAWLFEGKDVSKYVLPRGVGRLPCVPPAIPGEPAPKPLYAEQKARAGAFTLTNLPARMSFQYGGITKVKINGLSFATGAVRDDCVLKLKLKALPP
jgi:hypothetical protein